MASVDVIVPCYQYGHFLRDCAASVLTQDVSDLRLVIIDNASTDNTLEVARELAAADRRVEVIAHGSNLGHLASFNEGIDRASADYFLILCADDLLAPGALVRAVSIMERHPEVVLTYGAALVIGANETIPATTRYSKEAQWRISSGREFLERCCRAARGHIPGPTAVVRTSAQKQVGHYRAGLPHTSDLEVWLRFACLGAIAETDAVQGVIRGHAGNRCSSVSDIHHWDLHFEAAFDSFFAQEGGSLPDANRLRRAAAASPQRARLLGIGHASPSGQRRTELSALEARLNALANEHPNSPFRLPIPAGRCVGPNRPGTFGSGRAAEWR